MRHGSVADTDTVCGHGMRCPATHSPTTGPPSLVVQALARKEGGLVGAERGLKPLTAIPLFALEGEGKAAEWASVLQRQGCLGLQGALSPATAAQLLDFIKEENARCQADVEAGRVEFDARFGGVNCR